MSVCVVRIISKTFVHCGKRGKRRRIFEAATSFADLYCGEEIFHSIFRRIRWKYSVYYAPSHELIVNSADK